MFPSYPKTAPFYVSCPLYYPKVKKCHVCYIPGYSIAASNGCDDRNGSSCCEKCILAVSSHFMDHPKALTENSESSPFHFE